MLSDTPFLAPQQAPGQRGRGPRFVRQTPDGEGNRHYAVSYGAIWTWLGAIYFGVFVILAVAGVAQQNPNRPEGSSPTLSVDALAYYTLSFPLTFPVFFFLLRQVGKNRAKRMIARGSPAPRTEMPPRHPPPGW